jgi:membrane protease YdiL (CAAX protease family)
MKKSILKSIFVFIFYFIYDILVSLVIKKIGIDTSTWSLLTKNIYLISIHLIFLIIIIFIYKDDLKENIKDFKKNGFTYIKKYINVFLFGIILMGISNIIVTNITGLEMSNNEEAVREYIKLYPVYMAFSTVIYAPIAEEITFRKTIRGIINNKYLFILVSGFIFGFIHITGSDGVITLNDYLMSIPYMLMGGVFAYIYYDSDNILTTMSMHSIYNFVLLMIQFIGG